MLALTIETRTWMHQLPAWVKLAGLAAMTILFLPITDPILVAAFLGGVSLLYASLGRAAMQIALRQFRPILFIAGVIFLWHLLLGDAQAGLLISLRILALVALANAVTITTRLDDMIAVVTGLLAPLRRFGVSPEIFGLAVALAIRCIPVLLMKGDTLRMSWRARSPRRPGVQTLFPLVLVALDDADHMSEALRARGVLSPKQEL